MNFGQAPFCPPDLAWKSLLPRTTRKAALYLAGIVVLLSLTINAHSQTPVSAGFRDFSFGTTPNPSPTGEKPENKLWWNDGAWWGSLYSPASKSYDIFRLDLSSQTWIDTGTKLDTRPGTKADVFWDDANQKLYVVSHIFTENATPVTQPSQWGRLYRYTYGAATKTYTLDSKFPVNVTNGKEEALTIVKDSFGRLWITYVENSKVMVSHSLSDDLTWATPYVLPGDSTTTNTTSDDISGIVAFQGNKVGIFWSNEVTGKFYFAVHLDGDADTVWQPVETVFPDPSLGCTGTCSNDHFSLAASATDSSGRVFAALLSGDSGITNMPGQVWLAVRNLTGTWQDSMVSATADNLVRPKVLFNQQSGRLYIFATSPGPGGAIYFKSTDVNNIQFSTGKGTPFIQSSTDITINNSTATKQTVDSTTGLVILASDKNTLFYFHNSLQLTGALPVVSSFTPTSGPVGTSVTITGSNFTGATTVAFKNTATTSFTVNSDTQITATVPSGASTGTISVTTPAGTGTSTSTFTVTAAPVISSFIPVSGPVGTLVSVAGSGFTGATSVSFNGTNATSFSVVNDNQITVTVPSGATTSAISVTTPAGTGTSSTNFTVIPPPTITSFTPTSGPVGTAISIFGTSFSSATAVAFNGTAAAFTVRSDTQIDTTVPAAATTGKISVTNPAGSSLSSASFTVTTGGAPAPPIINSFSPTSGPAGTTVTLAGSGFTGTTSVSFNGTPATSFTIVSDVRIDAIVPAGATTGTISVTNTAGTAVSSATFTVVSTQIANITFEGGSLTDPSTGVQRVTGTVNLETASPLKGLYSATIPNTSNSYLEQSFTATPALFVSFYLRVNALPASDVRIALISNAGISIGNIYLRTNGSLRLRNNSTPVGSDTAPLILGQLYRVGIHQTMGSGANAVLEAFLAQNDNVFGAPFASLSNGTWTTGADRLRIGATITVATAITLDDIRLDSSSMPPPSTTTQASQTNPITPGSGAPEVVVGFIGISVAETATNQLSGAF